MASVYQSIRCNGINRDDTRCNRVIQTCNTEFNCGCHTNTKYAKFYVLKEEHVLAVKTLKADIQCRDKVIADEREEKCRLEDVEKQLKVAIAERDCDIEMMKKQIDEFNEKSLKSKHLIAKLVEQTGTQSVEIDKMKMDVLKAKFAKMQE